MSREFFEELRLPDPTTFLDVGPGAPIEQIALIMKQLQKHIAERRAHWLVVVGDTNSATAAAMAAAKLRVPVAHVEAGCRSYQPYMQEEVNRRTVSDCSAIHFTSTENCTLNLMREGFSISSIFLTGHPIVEVVDGLLHELRDRQVCDHFDVESGQFVLATLHREENVDDRAILATLLRSLCKMQVPVVFPIHPRTMQRIREFGLGRYLRCKSLKTFSPLKYLDTLALIKNAAFVFTDSGGVQQEAFILGTPCLTARNTTEWIETAQAGANTLVGHDASQILRNSEYLVKNVATVKKRLARKPSVFGDGSATRRIIRLLLDSEVRYSAFEGIDALHNGFATLRALRITKNGINVRRFVPYISMVFDKQDKPIVPEPGRKLHSGEIVLMFGPDRIIRKLTRSSRPQ
jgi:UDP-N-acetylglucosamine 2-epimerase (non-hydrolysing)